MTLPRACDQAACTVGPSNSLEYILDNKVLCSYFVLVFLLPLDKNPPRWREQTDLDPDFFFFFSSRPPLLLYI